MSNHPLVLIQLIDILLRRYVRIFISAVAYRTRCNLIAYRRPVAS